MLIRLWSEVMTLNILPTSPKCQSVLQFDQWKRNIPAASDVVFHYFHSKLWSPRFPSILYTHHQSQHICHDILLPEKNIGKNMQKSVQLRYLFRKSFIMFCLDSLVKCIYNENCLNQTSLWPTFVFGIDRCLVYIGYRFFLHWDVMHSLVYTGFWFTQGSY